jgi:hypothetical protein
LSSIDQSVDETFNSFLNELSFFKWKIINTWKFKTKNFFFKRKKNKFYYYLIF